MSTCSTSTPTTPGVVRWPSTTSGCASAARTSATDQVVVVGAAAARGRATGRPSEATIAEIVRWRREHQPGGQNCGSVFVNPVPGEVSAGALVDGLGLRGLRIGTAWVSEKHANFIQAADGGSAADVRAVIEAVRGAGRRGDRASRCAARCAWSGSGTSAVSATTGRATPSCRTTCRRPRSLDELLRAFAVDATSDARTSTSSPRSTSC